MPDEVLGIDWIALYLKRLTVENRLLNAFEAKRVRPLLDRQCASWREAPYDKLRIDAPQLEALKNVQSLDEAARRLCADLNLDQAYLSQTAAHPRRRGGRRVRRPGIGKEPLRPFGAAARSHLWVCFEGDYFTAWKK